jgi:hypothetical protein
MMLYRPRGRTKCGPPCATGLVPVWCVYYAGTSLISLIRCKPWKKAGDFFLVRFVFTVFTA